MSATKARCAAGATQISKIIAHIRRENVAQKINAAIFVGDAMEEHPPNLYDVSAALGALGVPLFMFQEGDSQLVETTFREMARLSRGAYCRFEPGAEAKLAELLRAVAAFAVGGVAALADQRTDAAKLLLTQMKK